MSRSTRDLRDIVGSSRVTSAGRDNDLTRKLKALAEDDKEMIAALQSKIDEQRREIEGRSDAISAIQRNFESLSSIYQSDKMSISELRAKLEQFQAKSANLEEQLSTMHEKVRQGDKWKREAEDAMTKFLQCEKQLNSVLVRNQSLEDENSILKQKLNMLAGSLEEARGEISSFKGSISEVLQKSQQQVRDLESRNAQCERKISELENDKFKMEEKNRSLSDELRAVKGRFEESERNLKTAKESQRISDISLSSVRSKMNELETNCAILRSTIQDLQNKLSNSNLSFQESKISWEKEKSILVEDKQRSEKDLGILHSEIERLQHECEIFSEKNQDLSKSLKDFENRLKSAQEKMSFQESKILQLEGNLSLGIGDKDREVKKWRDECLIWQKKCEDVEREKMDWKQKTATLTTQLSQMQTQMHSLQDQLNAKERERDVSGGRERQLEAENESLNQSLATLQSALDVLTQQREQEGEGHRKEVSDLNKRLQAERERADRARREAEDDLTFMMETEIQKWKDIHKDELSKRAKEHEERLAERESKLFDLRVEMKTLKDNLANVNKDKQELTEQLAKANDANSELQQTFQSKIKSLEEELSKSRILSVDIKEITGKLRSREQEIQSTLNKIISSELTTESALTCLKCMQLLENPVVANPCGHVFCEKCTSRIKPSCQECGSSTRVTGFSRCDTLGILSGKFVHRKQALGSLLDMCKDSLIQDSYL